MDYFTETERKFEAAKARLLAAQQEKTEATAEFLAARAALSRTLETLWPSPCECSGLPGRREDAERRQVLVSMR